MPDEEDSAGVVAHTSWVCYSERAEHAGSSDNLCLRNRRSRNSGGSYAREVKRNRTLSEMDGRNQREEKGRVSLSPARRLWLENWTPIRHDNANVYIYNFK